MTLLSIVAFVLLYTVNVHGTLSNQMGGWQAPMGITLIADLFSAILVAYINGSITRLNWPLIWLDRYLESG